MLKARQEFITEMLHLRSIIIYQLYLVLNMKQIAGFRYILRNQSHCNSFLFVYTYFNSWLTCDFSSSGGGNDATDYKKRCHYLHQSGLLNRRRIHRGNRCFVPI